MKKCISILASLSFVFIISFSVSNAQEINAEVVVNMEQLSFEARNYVSTMENDLERYLNNERFTDLQWEGEPIPVGITIYLAVVMTIAIVADFSLFPNVT